MKIKDLHLLPKVRDSWSYLYVEHCRIDQNAKAVAIHDMRGKTPVPCASLTSLVLGPGTTITHEAIKTLADNGCLVLWAGEGAVRFYAQGMGETRSSKNLLRQVKLYANPVHRLEVACRLYSLRFTEKLDSDLTLRQIRGKEGIRVRETYARVSRETGVPWHGRSYRRQRWTQTDPINRALSAANSCLYGVCQAAIVSAGYSPAIGFIHTGKMLSFVYDIADLYKTEISIPAAFNTVASGGDDVEARVRKTCRDLFNRERLMERIIPDIDEVLGVEQDNEIDDQINADVSMPAGLWDPLHEVVDGGVNYSDQEVETDDDRDS